jgi:hypothetical protein
VAERQSGREGPGAATPAALAHPEQGTHRPEQEVGTEPVAPVTRTHPAIEVAVVPVHSSAAEPIVVEPQAEAHPAQHVLEAEHGPGRAILAELQPEPAPHAAAQAAEPEGPAPGTTAVDPGPAPSAAPARRPVVAPAPTPPREEGRRAPKKVLTVAVVLIALLAVGVAGAAAIAEFSHHRAAQPAPSHRVAQPAPVHRAVRPRVAPTIPAVKVVPLIPGRLWTFAPLPNRADQTMLAISNPNRIVARVRIRTPGRGGMPTRTLQIPASGEVEVSLPPSSLQRAMQVRATVPILPLRLVIRHGKVSSWPGVRLSRSAGSG